MLQRARKGAHRQGFVLFTHIVLKLIWLQQVVGARRVVEYLLQAVHNRFVAHIQALPHKLEIQIAMGELVQALIGLHALARRVDAKQFHPVAVGVAFLYNGDFIAINKAQDECFYQPLEKGIIFTHHSGLDDA